MKTYRVRIPLDGHIVLKLQYAPTGDDGALTDGDREKLTAAATRAMFHELAFIPRRLCGSEIVHESNLDGIVDEIAITEEP